MEAVEHSRVVWTALGQVAGVFAIPLVLEARRSVARWRAAPRHLRRLQGLFYFLAAAAIFDAVSTSLFNLLMDRHDSGDMLLRVVTLSIVAAGLILNPAYTYMVTANRDVVVILSRAAPWSMFRKLRREFLRAEGEFTKLVASTLRSSDRVDVFIGQMEALKAGNAASDERLVMVRNAVERLLDSAVARLDIKMAPGERADLLERSLNSTADDTALQAAIDKQLRRLRKHKAELDERLMPMADRADSFDEVRPRLGMTSFDPNDLERLEGEVGHTADDAADRLVSPPQIRDAAIVRPEDTATAAIAKAISDLLDAGEI